MKKRILLLIGLYLLGCVFAMQDSNKITNMKRKGKLFFNKNIMEQKHKHKFIIIAKEPCLIKENVIKEEDLGQGYKIFLVEISANEIADYDKECVLLLGDINSKKGLLTAFKNRLNNERDKFISKQNLDKTTDDILEKDELEENLQKSPIVIEGKKEIPQQNFITPYTEIVQSYLSPYHSIEDIYKSTEDWVWVSDDVLWNVDEKWITPDEFLNNTPTLSTNPVSGKIASDCEEQANTLVSLIRGFGYPPDKIRVCLGKVKFDNEISNHAWVEIRDVDNWWQLEPTAGDYYDDRFYDRTLPPFDYFKLYKYPAEEYWICYNDIYYEDFILNKGNAPDYWKNISGMAFSARIKNLFSSNAIEYIIYFIKDFIDRILYTLSNLFSWR